MKGEKLCEVCGKRPATGMFRVLCDECRKKLRKDVLKQQRKDKRGKGKKK